MSLIYVYALKENLGERNDMLMRLMKCFEL